MLGIFYSGIFIEKDADELQRIAAGHRTVMPAFPPGHSIPMSKNGL
jgi:hypothetical protein